MTNKYDNLVNILESEGVPYVETTLQDLCNEYENMSSFDSPLNSSNSSNSSNSPLRKKNRKPLSELSYLSSDKDCDCGGNIGSSGKVKSAQSKEYF